MIFETFMSISGYILFILFAFLMVTSIVIILSLFKKKHPDTAKTFSPSVSIVIPAYNEESRIADCLRSVFKSKYALHQCEIIVVDDGSTDNTIEVVRAFKNVHVLKAQHKGKAAALNIGLKKAKHEYIITIDADTIIDKNAIKNLVSPMYDARIGATSGTYRVRNKNSLLTSFQNIEYSYNNLIRKSFSQVFGNGIWFFGAMACYRKSALKKIRYLNSDTLTEDMDVLLRLQKAGYRTIHAFNAYASTTVPSTIRGFFKQRVRWWRGVLQAMGKNKSVLKKNASVPLLFVYLSQWWWTLFAVISFPLFIMQILYWLPYNLHTLFETFMYFFRWFSFAGPLYVLYKIPEWGISLYSFFGVLSGLISVTFIIVAMKTFDEDIRLWDLVALFFYFPFTLLLNAVILVSLIRYTKTELWVN